MHWKLYYWKNPQAEGRSEGDFEDEEEADCIAAALGKALLFFENNKGQDVKVEIVQTKEPFGR